MARVIILGSSNAIPSADHDNTHMVVIGMERSVLIDCAGSPLLRLEKAGVDAQSVTDVILTHFHPDHVSGMPLFLLDSWLMGRRQPLTIHGLDHTLERVERLMEFHGWQSWPDFFAVSFHRLPQQEMTAVMACAEFRVFASPVHHLMPTIGLRMEFNNPARVVAYSADTQPCAEVVRLAAGADVLIHEATGKGLGHSSPEEAGGIASEAEVRQLFLIHYPTGRFSQDDLVADARRRFRGAVKLADDLMVLDLG
jgi:ribonuclease Z